MNIAKAFLIIGIAGSVTTAQAQDQAVRSHEPVGKVMANIADANLKSHRATETSEANQLAAAGIPLFAAILGAASAIAVAAVVISGGDDGQPASA